MWKTDLLILYYKSMRKGSAILWLLIVGLGAFVLFNVVRGISIKNVFKIPSVGTSTITYSRTPAGPAPMVDSRVGTISENGKQSLPTPPLGFSVGELSPFYKKAHIDSVVRASAFPGQTGQFAITADYSLTTPLNITGWSVRGNKSGSIFIPRAVADYNPNTFVAQQNADIVLESGGRVYVYGSQSPISNNFRLNKCTGYLNEHYIFNPNLPNECPRVSSTRLTLLSGKCQDAVRSLNACITPNPDELNRINGIVEDECRTLIIRQNQSACYTDHRAEVDFFSKEWRVWNGNYIPFDVDHDRLILFDKNGLVVDEYTY